MDDKNTDRSEGRYLSDMVYTGTRKKQGDDAARFRERARKAVARRLAAEAVKKVSA